MFDENGGSLVDEHQHTCLLMFSLAVGVLGYRALAGLSWIDSLLNTAMILSGMGQVNPLEGDAGKIFASFYALYAGVAFLTIAAVIIAPFTHRVLHRLHLDEGEQRPQESGNVAEWGSTSEVMHHQLVEIGGIHRPIAWDVRNLSDET